MIYAGSGEGQISYHQVDWVDKFKWTESDQIQVDQVNKIQEDQVYKIQFDQIQVEKKSKGI